MPQNVKKKLSDANDWHVFPGGRWGYHIEYIQISRNSIQKSYKYFANIVQMIGMFSQEEDGVTIWGPARGRSPLPQQVAFSSLNFHFITLLNPSNLPIH